jgi:hypothetical protein
MSRAKRKSASSAAAAVILQAASMLWLAGCGGRFGEDQ